MAPQLDELTLDQLPHDSSSIAEYSNPPIPSNTQLTPGTIQIDTSMLQVLAATGALKMSSPSSTPIFINTPPTTSRKKRKSSDQCIAKHHQRERLAHTSKAKDSTISN
ncbi:hypothetical protein CROQUDRAFT_666493 [Cronartium quercuum f. sp. fusiforme G11]|uniref:Uncharacterized protein n=1 Tax=Cronartium quercuum f. sp. fusiforme G11 TaxID=708437 RepID=A0A9P6T6H9_9BASI|nr:hypothetical protein CROQUDRAFT_666493 [Cronartium quercuum f. sp. fusiforme G11]